MEQRSAEWFAERLGHVTASRMADVQASVGTAARRNYMTQLIAERLTGQQQESFVNHFMQWGTDTEPQARAAYQAEHELVDETGFVKHPLIRWFGASPDGLVGKQGLVEIKCPATSTHLDWLLDGKVPAKHKPQMLAQLACTGRAYVDFVSFDPRLPEDLRLFVVRFEPTETLIKETEDKVKKFLAEVEESINKLRD